jgi:transcriptional regulator with XRE-family HTH domain
MTRQQLADSLGVTLGTIKQILSGQNYKRINVPIVKMMGRNQFDYLSRDAALSLRSS